MAWIAALALTGAAYVLARIWTGPQVPRAVGLGALLATALVLLVIWAETSGHLVAGATPSLRLLTGALACFVVAALVLRLLHAVYLAAFC